MEQINVTRIQPRVIIPEKVSPEYSRILSGFPGSITMRSGMVQLFPGKSVGLHSTGVNEELLIILKGTGEFLVSGMKPQPVEGNQFFYCPPETEHNVRNNGSELLQYVYVVAKAI